jgi:hypothetical protein
MVRDKRLPHKSKESRELEYSRASSRRGTKPAL